ncbi:MAG: endonuclease III, partial [Proteobacteria bacterium]|nr:endonuclease III [Pseudomonadota bacterium]
MTKKLATLRGRAAEIMTIFSQKTPHPKCELEYQTPFQLLVAVVLSAQTTDKSVNKCTRKLFQVVTTPSELYALSPQGLLPYIASLGLAPTKAKNLIKLSHMLEKYHGGQVPKTYDHLIELPGVGRKTAHVVLAELFRQPVLAVDTHVFRVGKRLGFHLEDNVIRAEKKLMTIIDKKYLPEAHHWLILHGRYVCK